MVGTHTQLDNSSMTCMCHCPLFIKFSDVVKFLNNVYRSFAKKGPVLNIRPPPIIASVSCKGLKFTPKRAHPIDSDLVRKVLDARLVVDYSYTEYRY